MGAVVSCIKSVFRAIGNALSAIINGIAGILKAIINGITNVLNIIISFLTCGRAGSRRSRMSNRTSHHGRTTRAI
ncbi:hypothetical protein BZA05DRAFT_446981 [Tricharina praecox]|uniref:uncharacterized protein n=1 Tax=Tricharina praecox TaxID=43433 RepID=UPI00221F08B6|nr:uncharacterized protein BZA05DRAFT_446981 [Tricharina praecox]KAI5847497.1 hypothetical protein BZA05DRAFT_446981 [Tricharina praecox]